MRSRGIISNWLAPRLPVGSLDHVPASAAAVRGEKLLFARTQRGVLEFRVSAEEKQNLVAFLRVL